MIYILVGIIILQFVYTIYKDEIFKRERKDLQLKLMSRDVYEYKEAVKVNPEKEPEPEPDPYVDPSNVETEKLLKAEDNL